MLWRKAVSPYAEEAAKIFWRGRYEPSKRNNLPTRLTQARRSESKAGRLISNIPSVPNPVNRCQRCGGPVTTGSVYCAKCVPAFNRESLFEKAKLGRIATHSPTAEARRSSTHMKQIEALKKWNPSELPKWFDEDVPAENFIASCWIHCEINPLQLSVSHPYATLIKRGHSIPHPRHWMRLAALVGYQIPTSGT